MQYSGYYGILVSRADNINIDNCYMYRTVHDGIVYSGSSGDGVNTGIVSNNIIENAGYPTYPKGGAALEIVSPNSAGATTNITVTHNKVFSSKNEGIGLYKKVTNSVVEYNTVYDIKTYHIYIDAGDSNIVRYNLVYNLDDNEKLFSNSGGGGGIVIENESERSYCYSGNNEVYGNLIAGQQWGIVLACQEQADTPSCICHENTLIYNNTLVDNDVNFYFPQPTAGDSIEIKNNISRLFTPGLVHVSTASPAGVTFKKNNYYGQSLPGGNAGASNEAGDPLLAKTSGWRSLSADSLDGTEFSLLSGSKAMNAGTSIPSYNDRITFSDFAGDPITVTTSTDSTPDIGTWMGIAAGKPGGGMAMAPPKGFKAIAQK